MTFQEIIEMYDNRTWLAMVVYKPTNEKFVPDALCDLCDYYNIIYTDSPEYLVVYLITQTDYEHFHDFCADIPINYTINS